MRYFILISIFAVSVFANQQLCENMAEYSCAPGRFEDDTGVVRSESEVRERINQYAASQRENVLNQFTRQLRQPSSSFFAAKTAAALGLAGSPACNTQQGLRADGCVRQLAQGLTDLTMRLNFRIDSTDQIRPQVQLPELQHVLFDENFLTVSRELYSRAQRDLIDQQQSQRIREETFPRVKAAMIQRLRQLNIPEEQRQRMITRLESIQFAGHDCGTPVEAAGMSLPPAINSLYQPQAFYSPSNHTFKYCSGMMMQTTSEYGASFIIAHELSHSIDPCNISRGPASMVTNYRNTQNLTLRDAEYPIPNILQCMRNPRSLGARNFIVEQNLALAQAQFPNPYMTPGGYYQIPTGPSGSPPAPGAPAPAPPPAVPTAGTAGLPLTGGGVGSAGGGFALPTALPLDYCNQKDQITESFSDWMAAESLPLALPPNRSRSQQQYQNGYANALRTICSLPPPVAGGGLSSGFPAPAPTAPGVLVHPETSLRINRIILQNPRIREQMGCPATSRTGLYCDSNQAAPLIEPGASGGMSGAYPSTYRPPGMGTPAPAPTPVPVAPTGVAQ